MTEYQDVQIIFKQNDYGGEDEGTAHVSYQPWPDEFEEIIKRLTDFEAEETFDKFPEVKKSVETIPSSLSELGRSVGSAGESEGSLTPSCLKHISISDSQLKFLNIYSFYPIPPDPGLLRAFWVLYPPPPYYPADGVDKFYERVRELGLLSVSSLRQQLLTDTVDVAFYGFDSELVQPLCEALERNTTVKNLVLQETLLNDEACYYLNWLLLRTEALSKLDLTSTGIGPQGVLRLSEGFSLSAALKELILSDCGLGPEGLRHLAYPVGSNTLIKVLDLSKNDLDEEAVASIHDLLLFNDSLERLNLSWNRFDTKPAAEMLFAGLTKNESLLEVDLSWNSMSRAACIQLNKFIVNTRNVERLNVSANRFTNDEVPLIAKALLENRSLKEFHISRNPITPQGAYSLINALTAYKFLETPLVFLNMESCYVNKIILPVLENMKVVKPNFQVKYGGVLENYEIIGPDLRELYFKMANYEAMAPKKKKDKKNFGHFILSLSDENITKDKFEEKVNASNMVVSPELITQLMKQFMITKKKLSQAEMKRAYQCYFPDVELPKPKVVEVVEEDKGKKKDKKSKKGKGSKKKKGKGKKK